MALALGVEKLFCGDTARSAAAMAQGTALAKFGFMFVGLYSMQLRRWMEKYGATKEQFAKVAVKNSYNGSLNPYAQFRKAPHHGGSVRIPALSPSRSPSTCVLPWVTVRRRQLSVPKKLARKYTTKPLVDIAACELVSGTFTFPGEEHEEITKRAAKRAYEKAGIGPEDVAVAEVHDGMAPAELKLYEELGFCKPGEAGRMIDEGTTSLTGTIPVNPSGGLTAKGHPVAPQVWLRLQRLYGSCEANAVRDR